MSLSSENMMKLMAYADGELQGSDESEVLKLLAKEPDAIRFVQQIADLGDFVQAGHPAKDKTFDIADAVMAKVKNIEPDAPKTNVVSLADAKNKRTQQITIGAGIVAALALAASIFLFKKPEETPMAKGPTPAPTTLAPSDTSVGVEVETAAESPGQSVKVFYGPGQNEMTTSVVIWVEEK